MDKGNIHSVIILFLLLFQIAVSKRCDRQILNVRAKTKYRIRNKEPTSLRIVLIITIIMSSNVVGALTALFFTNHSVKL